MAQPIASRAEIPEWSTELTELSPGVFAYVQAEGGLMISNAGLVTGTDGSLAVDALFAPRMTRAFLGEAAQVTAAPIRTLVTTHHHIDHTLGNYQFAGRTIIAHKLTRSEMQRAPAIDEMRKRVGSIAPHFAADMAEEFSLVLPNDVYDGSMTLYVDDREVQLIHVPTAHTIDDTLVYLPAEKLLYAGDVCFFYVAPLAIEGSILGWIEALKMIEGLDVERIIPGHGPVGTLDHLAEFRGYLELIRDEARRQYDAGEPVEHAVNKMDLGPYFAWTHPERIVPNTVRLYREFSGEPWEPIDPMTMRAMQGVWQPR